MWLTTRFLIGAPLGSRETNVNFEISYKNVERNIFLKIRLRSKENLLPNLLLFSNLSYRSIDHSNFKGKDIIILSKRFHLVRYYKGIIMESVFDQRRAKRSKAKYENKIDLRLLLEI